MTWMAIFLVSLALYYLKSWLNKKAKKLPPGPRGLPILGNLHMLGSQPHPDLHKLSQKHGPIMSLRLGFVPTIVVSSPQAAQLFLKTHDHVFASRPPLEAAKYMCYDQKDLTFGEYGPYWRNMRKLCTIELLSNSKINSFQPMRKEELDLLIESIKEATRDGVCVDLSAKVSSLSANMNCRMVLGKKYNMDDDFGEKGFKAAMREIVYLGATPNIGDYIPLIGSLDLQGLNRRMKKVAKTFDDFFEKIIDEHVHQQSNKKDKKIKDFVDVMLELVGTEESEYRIERHNIKAIILDMLVASTDTSAIAIEWTLSELIKNPKVMKRVQKELEMVVGMERMVEESDLENLEYLDMVIKESSRLHPPAPLLAPHQSIEDCTVGDYFIPAKSRVIVNAWAIMRDPSAWSEPDRFWPERFESRSIDMRGNDFELIPFGSGRRGCPCYQLGLTMIRLVVAQLVHCFDWELPRGMLPSDLDMTEEFGLTVARANHLLAVPIKYRIQC